MNAFTRYFHHVKKRFKLKNYITYFILSAIIITALSISLAGGIKMTTALLLEQIGYSIIAALSLSLVVGFLGELSLGHAAFMSIGAYIGTYIRQVWLQGLTANAPFVSLLLAILIGGIIAAIFGFIIGLPALRLKGDYLAIVTLAFGEIIKVIFQNLNVFGGAIGLTNEYRYNWESLFVICLVAVLITVIIINNLIKSKHGRAITAIRDNEIAARAMGINVTYYKLATFIISAFFAGVAGVLMGASKNQITAKTFDYNYSINILVMVVMGGMGSVNGCIISATAITFLDVKLQTVLTGNLSAMKNLVYALILVLVIIYTNAPKLKTFKDKYNPKRFFLFVWEKILKLFKKGKKDDPSEQKEFGADWSKIPTKIEMDVILSTDFKPDNSYVPDKPDKPKGDK